jgi:uncharacterized protein
LIPKIVIDTNIYISSIFWGGKPRQVVDLGRNKKVLIFSSSLIIDEIADKLKSKFNLTEEECSQIIFDFSTFTTLVETPHSLKVIDDDPDDDKFIECAVSSMSDYIVSGDKHLLTLKEYNGIKMLKASEFLSFISKYHY